MIINSIKNGVIMTIQFGNNINNFTKHPDDYILYARKLNDNTTIIDARKKGPISFLSNLISSIWQNREYQLEKINDILSRQI